MKKNVQFLMLFLVFNINAQNYFESGYLIDNQGVKKECFIQNLDWKNNPSRFKYRLDTDSPVLVGTLDSISEFGFENGLEYKRFDVKIDKSLDIPSQIDSKKDPYFVQEKLFLQKIVDGKAKLFMYSETNLIRFFYQIEDGEIIQLIYKKYFDKKEIVRRNNYYKKQLFDVLKNEKMTQKDFDFIDYTQKDISKVFQKYNSAYLDTVHEKVKNYSENEFRFGLSLGVRISKLSLYPLVITTGDDVINFDRELAPYVGFDLEYTLPFNNNKWNIIISPNYYEYKSTQEWIYYKSTAMNKTSIVTADFKYIEIPIALKYNFFIDNNNSIFLKVGSAYEKDIDAKITSDPNPEYTNIELIQSFSAFTGLGYNYKNFSFSFDYYFDRSLKSSSRSWKSSYNNLIFKTTYIFK